MIFAHSITIFVFLFAFSNSILAASEPAVAPKVFLSDANPMIVGLRSAKIAKAKLNQKFSLDYGDALLTFSTPMGWFRFISEDIGETASTKNFRFYPSKRSISTERGCVKDAKSKYGPGFYSDTCFAFGVDGFSEDYAAHVQELRSTIKNLGGVMESKGLTKTLIPVFADRAFETVSYEAHEATFISKFNNGDAVLERTISVKPKSAKNFFDIYLTIPLGGKDGAAKEKENARLETELNSILSSLKFSKGKN